MDVTVLGRDGILPSPHTCFILAGNVGCCIIKSKRFDYFVFKGMNEKY
jgi:hypothetical protein